MGRVNVCSSLRSRISESQVFYQHLLSLTSCANVFGLTGSKSQAALLPSVGHQPLLYSGAHGTLKTVRATGQRFSCESRDTVSKDAVLTAHREHGIAKPVRRPLFPQQTKLSTYRYTAETHNWDLYLLAGHCCYKIKTGKRNNS